MPNLLEPQTAYRTAPREFNYSKPHQTAIPAPSRLREEHSSSERVTPPKSNKKYFRSIFISDLHLGSKGANAPLIYNFLKNTESEYLYLVGDILDIWLMKKSWFWPQDHSNIIRVLLGKAKRGTKIVYIPGNHDELFKNFVGFRFGDIDIEKEVIHTTATGKRLLVVHGDEFDLVVKHHRLLTYVGAVAYDWLLRVNTVYNRIRRKMGLSYWSLSAYLKHKVKNATQFISDYEDAIVESAKKYGVDGVVCGHIHKAGVEQLDEFTYYNDGDWVESNTALVECLNGNLSLIEWRLIGDENSAHN